jgi:Phage-related protein, predicted endonuclease
MKAKTIGASQLAAALGKSPFSSRFDLYFDLTGQSVFEGSPATKRGQYLEEGVAKYWAAEFGGELIRQGPIYGEKPIYIDGWEDDCGRYIFHARPDYFAKDRFGNDILLEVKTTRTLDKKWEGDVPPWHYWIQVQMQLLATGFSDAILVAFGMSTDEIREYRIEYDEAAILSALDEAAEWWREYPAKNQLPPFDGSEQAYRAYCDIAEERVVEASPDVVEVLARYSAVRSAIKEAELEEKELRAKIFESMGGASVLTAEGRKVAWVKAASGRVSFDKERFESDNPGVLDTYKKISKVSASLTIK